MNSKELTKDLNDKNRYYSFEYEYSKLFKSLKYIKDLYVLKQVIFNLAYIVYEKYKKSLKNEKIYVSRYKPIDFPSIF